MEPLDESTHLAVLPVQSIQVTAQRIIAMRSFNLGYNERERIKSECKLIQIQRQPSQSN